MKIKFLFFGFFISLTAWAQFPAGGLIESVLMPAVSETGPCKLVILNQDTIMYKGNFGESVQPQRINILSSSQWLAAATLLALVDDGTISLDTEIRIYSRLFRGDKAEVTLRQLLTHTSGLPANSIFVLDTTLSFSRSVGKITRRINLVTPPGAQFVYGNVSYQLAGRLAVVVSGKDWETLFKEKIALPCNMTDTDFGNSEHINISEGAYSTAEDFANFLIMILNKGVFNGKRVLSEKSVNEMLSDQVSELEIGYTPYYFKSAMRPDYYGLGVWINRIMISDSTATEVSVRGANGFTPWISLCGNLGAVYAFDSDISITEPFMIETRAVINTTFDNCVDMQPEERSFYKDELSDEQVTNVLIRLEEDAMVSLKLFDVLGNEIGVLINGNTKAGTYLVPIETAYLARGSYFYRLIIDDRVETKKIKVKN